MHLLAFYVNCISANSYLSLWILFSQPNWLRLMWFLVVFLSTHLFSNPLLPQIFFIIIRYVYSLDVKFACQLNIW